MEIKYVMLNGCTHPELSGMLLPFLRQFKAHMLPSSVKFQHAPELCTHFCKLRDTDSYVFFRRQRGLRQMYLELLVPVHQVFLSWSAEFLFGPLPPKWSTWRVILLALEAHSMNQENSCHATHGRLAQNVVLRRLVRSSVLRICFTEK
jgi:hypothetical protein